MLNKDMNTLPDNPPEQPAETTRRPLPRAVWLHWMMRMAFIIIRERYFPGVPRLAVPPRAGDVRSLSVCRFVRRLQYQPDIDSYPESWFEDDRGHRKSASSPRSGTNLGHFGM